jgi:hypothetical protein
MYYPYFRGKQYELIAIRETAALMSESGFVPIIEPVKEALSGLERALNSVCDANGNAIVIVNPKYGDYAGDGTDITKLLAKGFEHESISAGILLTSGMAANDALKLYGTHIKHKPVFVHAGFPAAKVLTDALGDELEKTQHVFFEAHCGTLYRKHFKDSAQRVLLRDGFKRLRNADYPAVEKFSELHLTFKEEGMNGFGDFLIVGDDYSESGGPAYAVAIHLTFINPKDDEVMYIYHFVSTTKDTPTDPAGKFGQALTKLIVKLDSGTSYLYEGMAIDEFRALHAKKRFPGLGTLKKLSMIHHIETLAHYFEIA